MSEGGELERWYEAGRRSGRWLAIAVVVQAVAAGAMGAALVRQAGRPPTVVAVAADGQVWAGERRPFRPEGRMIEAWLRRVVGMLAADPAVAVRAGWASPAVADGWERAGRRSGEVIWREARVVRQGPEGLVVDLRLGLPGGAAGWAEERRVRLEVQRVGSTPADPLGLRLTACSWLTAEEFEAGERENRRRARLLGGSGEAVEGRP